MGYFPIPPGPKIVSSKSVYRKKYAFIPVKCLSDKKVWLKSYYKKYTEHTYTFGNTREFFENNLTDEECVFDKLVDAR